jgi:hypothetical protein
VLPLNGWVGLGLACAGLVTMLVLTVRSTMRGRAATP